LPNVNPAILDTLGYSGLSERDLRERALESREGMDLFEHNLSFVRRRIIGCEVDKPTLVVLPDSPATIESYDGFVEQLRDRFNIVLIEVPGFGFSYPKHAMALAFEETAGITANAITDLVHRKIVLVGSCVPGLVAARIAELIPERLTGLIMAQTGDFQAESVWCDDVIDPKGALKRPFEGQIEFRSVREQATIDWWAKFAAGPNLALTQFQAEARNVQRAGCCYALATLVQTLSALNPAPELRPMIPASIIWGLQDKSHLSTDRQSIRRYAPHAAFLELEDVGHFADIEAPEAFAGAALSLIAQST